MTIIRPEILQINKNLIEKYPFLHPTDERGAKLPIEAFGYSVTKANVIHQGWMKSFGLCMFDEILRAYDSNGVKAEDIPCVDFKCGARILKIIFSDNNEAAKLVADRFSWTSEHTCIECGGIATKQAQNGSPLCGKCANGQMVSDISHAEWIEDRDGKQFQFDGTKWNLLED